MPVPLDEQKILDIAAREFSKHGYSGVNMRDLSVVCGVSTQVFYYRFASKEDLYHEARDYALESFFEAVNQSLSNAPAGYRGPEVLAAAFFDAWLQNPTPLLLTNRDVITALDLPDKRLTAKHYPRVIKLILELTSRHFNRTIDETSAFCFASITFGFSSLMIIDEQHSRMLGHIGNEAEQAIYLRKKKATLMNLCSGLWSISTDAVTLKDQ